MYENRSAAEMGIPTRSLAARAYAIHESSNSLSRKKCSAEPRVSEFIPQTLAKASARVISAARMLCVQRRRKSVTKTIVAVVSRFISCARRMRVKYPLQIIWRYRLERGASRRKVLARRPKNTRRVDSMSQELLASVPPKPTRSGGLQDAHWANRILSVISPFTPSGALVQRNSSQHGHSETEGRRWLADPFGRGRFQH